MELNPIGENITVVMSTFPTDGLKLLRQMAETGFAPVAETRDPCVEQVVRANIGGIVSKEKSIVVGVPSTMWKDNQRYALVPTSESARNQIAIMVLHKEQERLKNRWWNRLKRWSTRQP